MSDEFTIKDSGKREEFASGMVRDTQTDKTDFLRVMEGPMFDRWATHLSKGAVKYPDIRPGVANWTLANGEAELARFKASAMRHFRQWLRGDTDEDHAAAVFFNVNGAEYVRGRLHEKAAIDTAKPVYYGDYGNFDPLSCSADCECNVPTGITE